jgi:hypothetical protein
MWKPDRKRIEVTQDTWAHLEAIDKWPDVLIEFWRLSLGFTKEQWSTLPEASFQVTDYELSHEDHDRLYDMLKARVTGKAASKELAWMWMDIGPCEPARDE